MRNSTLLVYEIFLFQIFQIFSVNSSKFENITKTVKTQRNDITCCDKLEILSKLLKFGSMIRKEREVLSFYA